MTEHRNGHHIPEFGLVCITDSEECRYRTLTRSRYLAMRDDAERTAALERLYWDNLARLHATLTFCARRRIRLYRVTSALFPLSDEPVGEAALRSLSANLSSVGRRARRLGIRVLMHPDQFVVLNSESPSVAATSALILRKHALAFDLMGLPRSAWSPLIIHGGKSGRAKELVAAIRALPPNVRRRVVLENDEYAFSAKEILAVCRAARVPMVFDAHHHVIHEVLSSYAHPSVARYTRLAGDTWPRKNWQIVHLSNGAEGIADRNHSDLIRDVPPAYARVPWIEVEARGKERAINDLRNRRLDQSPARSA
jgi:UV DNA damage endonuclease